MSGIFSQLVTQVKGIIGDAADKIEDPGRTARQTVRDLDADIAKADSAMVDVRAEYNRIDTQREKAEADVAKYAAYAERAVAKGDDSLARQALGDKQAAQKRLDEVNAQLQSLKPAMDGLKVKIDDLRSKRNQMASRTANIEARSRVADAQERVGTVIGSIGGEGSIAAFDRAEDKVAQKEARAKAAMQTAAERTGTANDDAYRSLDVSGSASVDDELAALKAKVHSEDHADRTSSAAPDTAAA